MTNPFSAHTTSTSLSAFGLSLILEPRKLRYIFVFMMFVVSTFCWCACCLCLCLFYCLSFFLNFLCFFFVLFFRGRIKHTEVCQLLRQMSPPVGIGKKCPKIVAYKVSKSQLPECHSCYVAELKHNNLFVFWREGRVGNCTINIGKSSPFNQLQEESEQLRTKQITK